jgi:hypothetical protein
MKHKHVWTPIAPEFSPCAEKEAETWKWCIRCGWLRLGKQFYKPGKHQKMIIIEEK